MQERERVGRLLHIIPRESPGGTTGASGQRPRDENIDRAIRLMRSDLARRWTVTSLARSVALSRPVFARRFVEQTGTTPLRYLTRCRMDQAASRLLQSDLPLAGIASEVGYDSEFAFNRVFKRVHGVPPGRFRKQAVQAMPVLRAAA